MRKEHFFTFRNDGENAPEPKPQELTFSLYYTIDGKEESVYETYNFYTRRMVGEYTLLDCCEIPSFYRPFYYNAALLLFPKNFEINNETHACDFIGNIKSAGKTTKNDNKQCHGRLFYSITNGATMEREVELISSKDGSSNGTVFRNTLDSVNFDLNKGEYNLTIKQLDLLVFELA